MPILEFGDPTPLATSGVAVVLLSTTISADDITAKVGIAADRSWRRGSSRAGRAHTHHGWEITSQLPPSAAVGDHLDALLARLEPHALQIATVLRSEPSIDGRLWITYRIENWNPGLHLAASSIGKVAALGLQVEIDIYCYERGELVPPTSH